MLTVYILLTPCLHHMHAALLTQQPYEHSTQPSNLEEPFWYAVPRSETDNQQSPHKDMKKEKARVVAEGKEEWVKEDYWRQTM